MTDRELMQQALEALQSSVPPTYDGFLSHCKAMNHIRIRLAQPEQEPESFEQWNAKQHGDPEEIGFLQALRIAYGAGQDSMTAGLTRLAQPEQGGKTGWPAGMLQDDSRELSKALASKPDAKQHAREAAHGIKENRND